MMSSCNSSGLVTQFENYFTKLAGAERVTVVHNPGHSGGGLGGYILVRIDLKLDPINQPALFDKMQQVCRAIGQAELEAKREQEQAKAIEALKTLKEFLKQ